MYILMSDLKPSDFEPYTTYKKFRGELQKFYIELFKKIQLSPPYNKLHLIRNLNTKMKNIDEKYDSFPNYDDVEPDVDDSVKQSTVINLYKETIKSMNEINSEVITEITVLEGGRMSSNKKNPNKRLARTKKRNLGDKMNYMLRR